MSAGAAVSSESLTVKEVAGNDLFSSPLTGLLNMPQSFAMWSSAQGWLMTWQLASYRERNLRQNTLNRSHQVLYPNLRSDTPPCHHICVILLMRSKSVCLAHIQGDWITKWWGGGKGKSQWRPSERLPKRLPLKTKDLASEKLRVFLCWRFTMLSRGFKKWLAYGRFSINTCRIISNKSKGRFGLNWEGLRMPGWVLYT